MPGRFRGSTRVNARALGSQRLVKRYRGDDLVWQTSRIILPFDGPNIDLDDTGEWTDLGPSTDYKSQIYQGMVRLEVPDGLFDMQFHRTSRMRYSVAQTAGDDGFIEVVPGTKGNGTPPIFIFDTYTTDVLRRVNNTGTTISGVGIRMRESKLYIVRYVSGTITEMVACGSFGANDRLRLKQLGNLHSLYRNGALAGEWNDSGASAFKGASYRSLLLSTEASKPLLFSRRFSPAIDFIEAA